jgi:hypothetical protein
MRGISFFIKEGLKSATFIRQVVHSKQDVTIFILKIGVAIYSKRVVEGSLWILDNSYKLF